MSTRLRLLAPVIALTFAVAACSGAPSAPPGTSTAPAASASAAASALPEPSATPPAAASTAICTDVAGFRASLLALTNLQLVTAGPSGVKTALTDLQSSAQALLTSGKDLVVAPVSTLLTAAQGLQATLTGLGDQAGLGAKLAAVKTAIAQITTAAADVETALGTTCPAQ